MSAAEASMRPGRVAPDNEIAGIKSEIDRCELQ